MIFLLWSPQSEMFCGHPKYVFSIFSIGFRLNALAVWGEKPVRDTFMIPVARLIKDKILRRTFIAIRDHLHDGVSYIFHNHKSSWQLDWLVIYNAVRLSLPIHLNHRS